MPGSFVITDGLQHERHEPVAPATKLPDNSAVMLSGGQLKPASGPVIAAGNGIFAGVTYNEYNNPGTAASTLDLPVLVRTGFVWECGLDPADSPTATETLKDVALSTNTTVKKTVAVGDQKVRLLQILPGARARVLVYP